MSYLDVNVWQRDTHSRDCQRISVASKLRGPARSLREEHPLAHNWSPSRQLQRGFNAGQWFLMDGSTKLAFIEEVEHGAKREKLYLSLTYHADADQRRLIGFFPTLAMAAEITWAARTNTATPAAPTTEWTPFQDATPVEWVLHYSVFDEYFGVIRKLTFGSGSKKETWYRAVTWAENPAERQLIGYARTPEPLAQEALDRMIARHQRARDDAGRVASGYASARRPTVGSNA